MFAVELRALLMPAVTGFVDVFAEGILATVGIGTLATVEFCEFAGSKYRM
jgi:hypothetical protein